MTVEPIIVFNILITLIALWVAMAVNAKFLQPALLNKKRFAIYELRDRLALLAMRGVVDETSEEYRTLITLINGTLCSTKGFRITEFLNMHAIIYRDKAMMKHIDSILERIHNEDMPLEYKDLVAQFFRHARDIYKHKIWGLKVTLWPILVFFSGLAKIISSALIIKKGLANQLDKMKNTEHKMEENIARLVT
jgi:hypothetical protein